MSRVASKGLEGAVAAALLAILAGCDRSPAGTARDGGAAEAGQKHAAAAAAGPEVTALLDGLRVGGDVGGYTVTWVGAVQPNGVIPIQLERGGMRVQIVVALDAERPRPPARTERYAVYYEKVLHGHGATDEESGEVARLVAKRIEKVERRVPEPAGMRTLPPASQPM